MPPITVAHAAPSNPYDLTRTIPEIIDTPAAMPPAHACPRYALLAVAPYPRIDSSDQMTVDTVRMANTPEYSAYSGRYNIERMSRPITTTTPTPITPTSKVIL